MGEHINAVHVPYDLNFSVSSESLITEATALKPYKPTAHLLAESSCVVFTECEVHTSKMLCQSLPRTPFFSLLCNWQLDNQMAKEKQSSCADSKTKVKNVDAPE